MKAKIMVSFRPTEYALSRIPILLWIIFLAIPPFLLPGYGDKLIFGDQFSEKWVPVALLTIVAFCNLIEAYIIVVLVHGLCTLRIPFRALISVTLLFIYFLLLLISWCSFALIGRFLTWSDLGNVTLLADYSTIVTASPTDAATVLAIFIGAGVISLSIFWWLRKCQGRFPLRTISFHGCIILLAVFVSVQAIRFNSDRDRYERLKIAATGGSSPQMTLWWGRLLFGLPRQLNFNPTPLELTPYESPQEYAARAANSSKVNVVFLLIEALRADVIGAVIDGVEITPNLNQLAASNLLFERAYANSPDTGYSQVNLTTGQLPLRTLARDIYLGVDYPIVRIYDMLHEMGYQTALFTNEWEPIRRITASNMLDIYFDVSDGDLTKVRPYLPTNFQNADSIHRLPTSILDQITLGMSRKWIIEQAMDGEPFFCSLYLYASHMPYHSPIGHSVPLSVQSLGKLPSFFKYPPEWAPIMKRRYLNTLHYVDSLVGELVVSLEEQGLKDNTVLIITGDHGEMFGEHGPIGHGGPLFEEAVRVPLIITGPRHLVPNRRVDVPVQHIDIPPTILSLLGAPSYSGFQGNGLVAAGNVSEDGLLNRPNYLVVQSASYEVGVVKWPWKLVTHIQSSETRLHNLALDPFEEHDLSLSEPEILRDLASSLQQVVDKQLSYYQAESKSRRMTTFPPTLGR